MSKIYLNKLCDFILSTYNNYESKCANKDFNFDDFINNIKQNLSLNERGFFFKYNFIELKKLVPFIEYDHLVLINPICFNICGNLKWFNFLNAILTILNDNYIYDTNLVKKKILEITDKIFRKKIIIPNEINDNIILNVSLLTNSTLIIIAKDHTIKMFNNKENINKVVVIFNENDKFYGVLNWDKKHYEKNSQFVQYLIEKSTIVKFNKCDSENKFTNVINKKNKIDINEKVKKEIVSKNRTKLSKKNNNLNMFDFHEDTCISECESIDAHNDTHNDTHDDTHIDTHNDTHIDIHNDTHVNIHNDDVSKNDTGSKDKYEELQADVNYALYISEVVDINKNKKKKDNKNIFIQKNENLLSKSFPYDTKKNINLIETNNKPNDKPNDMIIDEMIDKMIDETNDSTVFNKSEKISKNDVDEIIGELKMSVGLDKIQSHALKFGISIFQGSTKSGKPKNKTKLELITQIKEHIKNNF